MPSKKNVSLFSFYLSVRKIDFCPMRFKQSLKTKTVLEALDHSQSCQHVQCLFGLSWDAVIMSEVTVIVLGDGCLRGLIMNTSIIISPTQTQPGSLAAKCHYHLNIVLPDLLMGIYVHCQPESDLLLLSLLQTKKL